MYTILKYVLLLLIVLLLAVKVYHLSWKDSSDIDAMEAHLAPVTKSLTPNSSIGFYSNASFDTALYKYAYAGFVLHPVVVKAGDADTVLCIIDKRLKAVDASKYTTIAKNEDSYYIYSLIKKNK